MTAPLARLSMAIRMEAKRPLLLWRVVFFLTLVTLALNKFLIRPWVIDNDFPYFVVILVYSWPNFIEAIAGTILLTGIAFALKNHFHEQLGGVRDASIYWFGALTAGCYVITQELMLHHLGGKNVYDPFDVLASIIGLMLTNWLMRRYGFNA